MAEAPQIVRSEPASAPQVPRGNPPIGSRCLRAFLYTHVRPRLQDGRILLADCSLEWQEHVGLLLVLEGIEIIVEGAEGNRMTMDHS